MTTIACDGSLMVSESMTSSNGIYSGLTKKIHRLNNGDLFASTGYLCDGIKVFEWLNGGVDKKPEVDEGFGALLLCKETGDCFLYGHSVTKIPQSKPAFIGSGYELAMGAYEACGDLVKAVEIACKFDIYSGGEIQCLSIIDLEVSK